jgi:hypothetical protein
MAFMVLVSSLETPLGERLSPLDGRIMGGTPVSVNGPLRVDGAAVATASLCFERNDGF